MAASDQAHTRNAPRPPAPRLPAPAPTAARHLLAALALLATPPSPALARERPPGAVPLVQDTAALHDEIERLRGRVDELGIELQRQERLLGALATHAPEPTPAPTAPPTAPVLPPRPDTPPALAKAAPPAPPQSNAPALIVMVGNDGALTLDGRPAALPTLGYALRAASGGDATRRVVVGAEPKASPAQVGEVVSALSMSGFGRITITGP